MRGLGALAPSVVAAAGDLEDAAEDRDRDLGLLGLDKREPYALSLAKKAAAFFRLFRLWCG